MAIIVVDASAVLSVVLREGAAGQIKESTRGCELISPESLPLEVANVLSLGLIQASGHKPGTAALAWAAFQEFRKMQIRLVGLDDRLYRRMLELSFMHRMYAYDAAMLAVAERHHAQLLTLDGFAKKKRGKPGLKQHAEAEGITVVGLKLED